MARQDQNSNDLVWSRARYILMPALRVPAWMAGTSPIGAKLRDLHNAFSVMPGLVPGIHVVPGLAGCRTSTLSAEARDVIVLDLH
jgi:hypothetical protein